MTLAAETPERATSRLRPIHVVAVAAGNGLEFFDFLIYATFAIFIGKAYFPSHVPGASLLLSLATFWVGFLPRPLGSLVIGLIGDRIGRRPAMLISFSLMGVGALGLAATPTYAQIGFIAPILVVLSRLVQGFALGGEVGPSTTFLVEAAGENRRGLIGSFQQASQGVAILAASGLAVLLAYVLPQPDLAAWGWRLGFWAGLMIVPFGLLVRRTLPETAPPKIAAVPLPPDRTPWLIVALGVMMLASGTINTYVGQYMTTFAMNTMHLSAKAAFGVGVVNGACSLVCLPIGGWLSDRFGRKIVAIPCLVVSAALLLPALSFALAHPTALALYAATAVVTIPGSLGSAAILVAITESFPPSMRCLAVGLVYAGAIAVFGGSAQFVVQWLVDTTHQPMAPAYYRFAASLVGLAALTLLPESAPIRRPVASPAEPVLAGA